MCAVIGIFCHGTQRVNRIHILLPRTLHESVVVALTFSTSPHVVDDGARNAAIRMVGISLCLPMSVHNVSIEVHFYSKSLHITILPSRRCVVGDATIVVATTISEGVFSIGRKAFGIR